MANPAPLDLSLAWSRCLCELGGLRRHNSELQQELDRISEDGRRAHAAAQQLATDLAATRAQGEELRLQSRHSADDNATLTAKVAALRLAMSRLSGGEDVLATVVAAPEAAGAEVEAARRRAQDAEAVAAARATALEQARQELGALRRESARLGDVDVRLAELQRAHEEMQRSYEESLPKASSDDVDSDLVDSKVLHLLRRPGHAAEVRDGGMVLRDGDLERAQVLRQLERFKRATKKYVQDFREGIYGLLGWKVEMRGEGRQMHWHLVSRYGDGRELIFKLRPASPGHGVEFDLLASELAEQLQEDRQAMACLEVYRSIPSFLAHVTADLLAQRPLPDA